MREKFNYFIMLILKHISDRNKYDSKLYVADLSNPEEPYIVY